MIKIKSADNGYIVEDKSSDTIHIFKDESVQDKVEFVYHLLDMLGMLGSRYDKERIRVVIEPGDKYESGAV